jgi:hypothetical protein
MSETGKVAAIINSDGIVENMIVWDDQSFPPEGKTVVVLDYPCDPGIGWIYVDGQFTNPNPIVIPYIPVIETPTPSRDEINVIA